MDSGESLNCDPFPSSTSSSMLLFIQPFLFYVSPSSPPGLSQEKVATFIKRLRAEPRYLLAQNVSTCIDPLEVCLHRQTVQDTVHIFQHSIPTEGKPITNQKNSGRTDMRHNNIPGATDTDLYLIFKNTSPTVTDCVLCSSSLLFIMIHFVFKFCTKLSLN